MIIKVGISVVSKRMKNKIRSVVEKVSNRVVCSAVSVTRNIRFRERGSVCR